MVDRDVGGLEDVGDVAVRRAPTGRPALVAPAGFDDLVRSWLTGLRSDNTRDAYARDLARFHRWCAANGHAPLEVRAAQVRRYSAACDDEGAGRATIKRRLTALSSFFAHAVAEAAVPENPVAGVDRPAAVEELPRPVLDESQSHALFAAAGRHGPKVAALVALLLWDGFKLREALALDVEHVEEIDDGRRLGRPLRARVVRRGAAVAVALDDRSAAAIRTYVGDRDGGPLLLGNSPTLEPGLRLSRFGADYLLKRAAQGAGLGGAVSANTLQRTFRRHAGHSRTLPLTRDARRSRP